MLPLVVIGAIITEFQLHWKITPMLNRIVQLKLWQRQVKSRIRVSCILYMKTKKRFSVCLSDFLLDGTDPLHHGLYFNVVHVFNNNTAVDSAALVGTHSKK